MRSPTNRILTTPTATARVRPVPPPWSIGANNELLFDGTYTYTYDADGNETAKFIDVNHTGVLQAGDTDVTQYTWDADNRLVQVTDQLRPIGGTPTQIGRLPLRCRGALDRREHRERLRRGHARDPLRLRWQPDRLAVRREAAAVQMTNADLSHRYLWGPAVDQLLSDEQIAPQSSGQGYNVSTPGTRRLAAYGQRGHGA